MKRLLVALVLTLAACGRASSSAEHSYGPNPQLPAPESSALPTIHTAKPVGWPQGAAPHAPPGFAVTRYAESLAHPRMLYVLPNGDVLVAESATQPTSGGGFGGWVQNQVQQDAGATPASANRITLLRDDNGDGVVDSRHVFAEDLNQPFGMVLVGDYFYVANTDAVVRFHYMANALRVTGQPEVVLRLPHRDGDNGHWTRNLIASPDGSKIYVSVGSSSNIADHGMAAEQGRAAIWQMNPDGSDAHVYASGLRNPVGMSWEPIHGGLWVGVNERDMLGDNLVPDYITSVHEGAFYGWPYYYWGDHRDVRVQIPANVRLQAPTAPDFAMGAHTASLGLHIYQGEAFPESYWGGAFVGQHGSWNRNTLAGYKVVFVPFSEGRPEGAVQDFLTGFLNDHGEAQGRPVGLAMDHTGALLVADDTGNIVWRVAYTRPAAH